MPPRFNALFWNYYEPSEDRIATCKQCNKELSYKSTSHNLLHHLKIKHVNSYNDFRELNPKPKRNRGNLPKYSSILIWKYFKKNANKIADCRLCNKKLSYKTTIANLKRHLSGAHIDSYNEFLEQAGSGVVKDPSSSSEDNNAYESDDAEELQKATDVWRYFDNDSGKKAQCVVCQAIVVKEYEELKTHLRDQHPNLLLELLQDQNSDVGSNDGNDDNDNTYTEIVYLEQEPTPETVIKHKEKPKTYAKPIKKRERHSIYSSDDIPVKRAKKEEENDELTTFIKYITCLLKKLPADVFSNVQIEIINTILKANNQANAANTSQSTSMVFNKELLNTSSNIVTVEGMTPISSTMMGHHNYTLSVTPPKESEAENNS